MTHALAEQVQTDPHLKFAHYVDAVLVSSESLDTKAIKIKSAAALYVGECQAREMRAYEAARTEVAHGDRTAMPRFVERTHLLGPAPLTVVAPSEPTTEFEPMTPDNPADVITTPPPAAAHDDSEPPCPNDDASTAGSSTTSSQTAADDAHDASQQPPQHASDGPAAANADSAGTSADASSETSTTSKQPAASAKAARSTAVHAASRSPKTTPRRLGTR